MSALISVRNLSFAYGGTFRLNHINFDLEEGSFWGAIGPNGSGKSTMLKALSKVISPETGTIELNGKSLRQIPLPQIAKVMAVVGSESYFAFPYHVIDVVMMGRIPFVGRIGSYKSQDFAKAEEAMRKTDTLNFRDRFIHELSSGEKQRVLLARALAQEPRILFLDEPTAHLDLHYEIQIFQILKALNRSERLTILTISHNLNLIAEFCDRVILLNQGICERIGAPKEVFEADLLKRIFRIECTIGSNPFSGAPTIHINSQA